MTHNDDFYAGGQGGGEITYRPSSHQFTDPVRLFKANDPYYWEVDNVPIQQLQENLLWLKDQVSVGATELATVSRSDITELKPSATGSDRAVTVSPGRFTARVNDAYGTGISTMAVKAAAAATGRMVNEIEITTPNITLQNLAGVLAATILQDNGLYDFVQHNVTAPANLYNLDWTYKYTSFKQNDKSSEGTLDLQKIKLALWKQGTTVRNFGADAASHVGLQQLSVEFTRVYGAPFRTAIVNVPTQLSINVPMFDSEDYQNSTNYVPSVRIDLLFIYTHPIDASSTAILRPDSTGVATINQPMLGLVKGAGVISLNGKGAFEGIPVEKGFFTSDVYKDGRQIATNYFEPSGNFDAQGNMQTASVISDLNQTQNGMENVFGNFPSPDDLLNAAPYITDGVAKTSLQMIGQSVLPIAYVISTFGTPTISTANIIDIRPFFRTAELTYNERAGLAAANPPASLANPVVTKYQLADTAEKVRDYIKDNPADIPQYPRPVGTGYVFGGIKYGPEGVLARLAADADVATAGGTQLTDLNPKGISDYLKAQGYYPQSLGGNIPQQPDWDTPDWSNDGEGRRNDKFHMYYNDSMEPTYPLSQDTAFDAIYGPHVKFPTWQESYGFTHPDGDPRWTGYQALMIRKRIDFTAGSEPEWMVDYDVRLSLVNCALADSQSQGDWLHTESQMQQVQWMNPHGLYVEKHTDHFIICGVWNMGDPINMTKAGEVGPGAKQSSKKLPPGRAVSYDDTHRNTSRYSKVFVTSENGMLPQGNANKTVTWAPTATAPMFRGQWCTYPTVKFEIIGYPAPVVANMKIDAGTNNFITLTS